MFQLTNTTSVVPISLDVYSCLTFEAFMEDFLLLPIIPSRKNKQIYIKRWKKSVRNLENEEEDKTVVGTRRSSFSFLWRFFLITLNVRCVNLLRHKKRTTILLRYNFSSCRHFYVVCGFCVVCWNLKVEWINLTNDDNSNVSVATTQTLLNVYCVRRRERSRAL